MDAAARGSTPPEEQRKDSKDNPKAEAESNPSQSPSGRLVYVRRRVEVDTSTNKQQPLPTNKSCLVTSSTPTGWEERYHHLQMLLNKLNRSDHTDRVQMLWSLSSAELSKHAVDLEKRSIQFSLEEAREMQRVAALNVLGKSLNTTSNDGE